MKIRFGWSYFGQPSHTIDLDDFLGEDFTACLDEDELHQQLKFRIYALALQRGCKALCFLRINEYITDGDDVLDVPDGALDLRIAEVVKLAQWTNKLRTTSYDTDRLHGLLNDDWDEWIEDDFDDIGDRIFMQFDEGDYEALAKEMIEVYDYALDDALEPYFDYSGYGESQASDHQEITWKGTSYLINY